MKSNLPLIIFGVFILLSSIVFIALRNREEKTENETNDTQEDEKSDSEEDGERT